VAVALSPFDAASRQLLGEEGVSAGRMLHNVGLRGANGKYFGFERGSEVVVKLPAARVAALIASGEGSVMDRGQPMSRPRVSRTVARRPCSSSAARKASMAPRLEPTYGASVGLYGMRLTLNALGSSSSASATACS
jgi:hypothetical protein